MYYDGYLVNLNKKLFCFKSEIYLSLNLDCNLKKKKGITFCFANFSIKKIKENIQPLTTDQLSCSCYKHTHTHLK